MDNNIRLSLKYLNYLFRSSGAKNIHSPFVFDFYQKVLKDKKKNSRFEKLEDWRRNLLKNNDKLPVKELGAGSRMDDGEKRSVKDIARYAGRKAKYGRMFYRLAQYLQAENILELGTSLGLSTIYLASAQEKSQITTLEGWPEVLAVAKEGFEQLNLRNIRSISGNFDDTLAPVLKEIQKLDLAFIDGNHREEPTLQYFEQLLPKVNNDSVLIFDDIYWTSGMEKAWNTIRSHPDVTLTIDIFYMGAVFFKKEIKEKQHFTLRY